MRAIWKGYLKCSLVTIPIKMFTAVTKRPLQFHLYHKECGSRISQENVCPVCGKTLSAEEIVKGYQYGKDLHVVLTEADFQEARQESTDIIDVLKFVDAEQINPIYYTDAYYLAPDGQAGAEAFAVFHQAMMDTGKTAVARAVLRNREYLYNLRPHNGAFIAFTLHYAQEIRALGEIEELAGVKPVKVSQDNLEMAKTIIDHLSGDFVPADYRDEYSEARKWRWSPRRSGKRSSTSWRPSRKAWRPRGRPPKKGWPGPGPRPGRASRKSGSRPSWSEPRAVDLQLKKLRYFLHH
jgi:DNA end-binding protein Ku